MTEGRQPFTPEIKMLAKGNGMDPALAAEWNLERQLR